VGFPGAPEPEEVKPAAVSGCRSSLLGDQRECQRYRATARLGRLGGFLGVLLPGEAAKSVPLLFAE